MVVRVSATYIWLDAKQVLRDKEQTIMMSHGDFRLSNLPQWKFDGSSTGQAAGEDSDVLLKPVFKCKNPFRKNDNENILVLCETLNPNGTPHETNLRHRLVKLIEKYSPSKPWAGFEQEWFAMIRASKNQMSPLAWVELQSEPEPQGPYYCSVGLEHNFGGDLKDTHYEFCLDAGLSIAGTNTEVAPGQHEFQIGPINGQTQPIGALESCDQLIVARWILKKLAAYHGLLVSFDPKPVEEGDWNGSGCHTNFSTAEMREDGGLKKIYEAAEKLRKHHKEHIKAYGEGNERRLTGKHETSSLQECEVGVAHRGRAIRIPTEVARDGKGYMEIRQPASNCSPYLVITALLETILGEGYKHKKTGQ